MKHYERVRATFTPRNRQDLREGADAWIGRELLWEAYWLIDEGTYKGEWAMGVIGPEREQVPFVWAPSVDLQVHGAA